jgi:DNA-binding LacI/PurR family transcriptional regulator
MEEAGAPVDPSMCVPGNYHDDLAHDVTKLLMTRANRPTAIIGANNVTALGALQAILGLGFRCPQDGRVACRDRRRAVGRTRDLELDPRLSLRWVLGSRMRSPEDDATNA